MPTHELAYDACGSGRALVLLHAFPLDRQLFWPQRLAPPAGWRLLTPDLAGFGTSPGFGPHETPSVDALADDVAALLDRVGASPAVVGGVSMGGYVALAFARRHPDKLAGLVLIDTRAEPDTAEAKANRDKQIQQLQAGTVVELAEAMLPKLLGATTRAQQPALADEIRRIAAAQPKAGVIDALRALRDRPDAAPALAAVRVPTLVVVGAEDEITPPANADTLARLIPNAQRHTIPGAGHLSTLERPEEFQRVLAEFLAGC